MRTPAKALVMRTARRRLRVRLTSLLADLRLVEDDAREVCDPQTFELVACLGVLTNLLLERATDLDEDCVP